MPSSGRFGSARFRPPSNAGCGKLGTSEAQRRLEIAGMNGHCRWGWLVGRGLSSNTVQTAMSFFSFLL